MSAQYHIPDPPSDAISSLRFSPSGTKLAVSSWDRTVSIYLHTPDADQPFVRETGIQCRAPVLDVCWGPDEETLFAVGLDQDVRVLKNAGDEQEVLSTHEAAANKVIYSHEHGLLISTSWDGIMHVHRPASKQYVRVKLPTKPFALSLTSTRLVVAMAKRKLSVYELQSLSMLVDQTGGSSDREDVLEVAPWQQRESSLKFQTRALTCMPDGTGFATSSIEGRVGVEWFDPEAQKNSYAFRCHRQTQTSPAPANADGATEQGETEVDLIYPVNALAFHPTHGSFATGGGDGAVALWDTQMKRRIRQYGKLGPSVAAVDFSSDGKFLAIGISPGFEDGFEEKEPDPTQVKIVLRQLAENEAKGKAAK
ncbi:hypothetical protein B0A50_08638 [Salinomyces thailandicus]|uniref:Uncharacterized protein n=1 Tax=Salinomyces thailandicus TaxID=706561 RepID=A0A4U0TJ33_9PEZI|nr:hypothetical protein B0A50_08638 [Salinomyces thailandica]